MIFEQIIHDIETTLNRVACSQIVEGTEGVVGPTLLQQADALAAKPNGQPPAHAAKFI